MRVLLALCAAALTLTAAPPEELKGPDAVREKYTKYEFELPMRDGVKLFTSVYVPKDKTAGTHLHFRKTAHCQRAVE